MKDGYWVVRTYQAGAVGEKTKFWVPGTRPSKSSRKEKLEIKKQEQNEYSALKQVARLINANFVEGDWFLGLDYSPAGMERLVDWARKKGLDPEAEDETVRLDAIRSAAEHELTLVLRRVKHSLAKEEQEQLRYIAITSDMDGDTGEIVRVHHHLIVPRAVREVFVEKWKELGHVAWSPLSKQDDYTPIAEYLLRQVRRIPDAKKYTRSRNLIVPKPKDRAVTSDAELRVPRGGKLLFRNEYKPGRPQYIRYTIPAKKTGQDPPEEKTA